MKKIRNVALILALLLSFNGCEKNPVEEESLQNNEELTVDQAKAFVETQRMNEFTLKSVKFERNKIKIKSDWNKSERSNNGNISVVETQIQAMGSFGFVTSDCMAAWNSSKNDAYLYSMSRLVVIKLKKTGEMYSFIMTITADKHYLEGKKFKLWDNTYLKRDNDLSGYILFHTLSGEFVNGWIYCDGQITNSLIQPDNLELPLELKSAELMEIVYTWVQECTDWYTVGWVDGEIVSYTHEVRCTDRLVSSGSYIAGGGSVGGGTTGGGGIAGGYTPPSTQPCNCTNICPVCVKCLDYSKLKSAVLPGDGTTTTTPATDPCQYCEGHPLPAPTTAEVFFENIKKINMDSPSLLQEISCLIRTLANSGQPVFIPDVIEGVGDTYVNGYEYTQKDFNYQGHNVRIIVVYDPINQTNHIGTSTDEQGSQLLYYEIYVKAKMQPTRKMPNLIRLKFDPNDRDFFISVWKHIKGETNLWDCN